jgi:hypothetical protein
MKKKGVQNFIIREPRKPYKFHHFEKNSPQINIGPEVTQG